MRITVLTLIVCTIFLSSYLVFMPIKPCEASGGTLHVGAGQMYSSIQEAIDAADEGNTIYVHSGTYSKNIIVDKTLTLTGESSGITTITGSGTHTVKVTADDVSISGFTIKNVQGGSFSCIFLSAIENCSITNNIIKYGGNGVYLVSSNINTIKDNTVEYNKVGGIYLSGSYDNTIQGNTLRHNNAYGVFLSTSNSNTIYLNHFSDNMAGNARDLGSNSWSYGTQGNYWDDYEGVDELPPIGIGDTPYSKNGVYDPYPLGYFQTSNQRPIATIITINPTNALYGTQISFSGMGDDSDGTVIAYNWTSSINDLLSTAPSFSTTGLSVGLHTIYFKVQDDDGEWSSEDTQTITITAPQNQKPVAHIISISPQQTTFGTPVYFNGYGTDDETVVSYKWISYPDGVLSDQKYFSKSDLSVGTHRISFQVLDNEGVWSDADERTIIISSTSNSSNHPPVALAGGPYSGNVNVSISFDGSNSYDPDDDSITYYWDFGDGTDGTNETIEHIYNSTGNYTVKLTVTDSHGSTHMDSTYANIIQPNNQSGDSGKNKWIPGFEILFVFIAVVFILAWKRYRL